jgi:hypothetical protein
VFARGQAQRVKPIGAAKEIISPFGREESGKNSMVGLANHQQVIAVILDNHVATNSSSIPTELPACERRSWFGSPPLADWTIHYAFDRDVKPVRYPKIVRTSAFPKVAVESGLHLVGLGYEMDANPSPFIPKAAEEGFHFSGHVSLA